MLEAVRASGAPVDGITLDGDVMRRKGTISGGFVNANRSKILTHKRVSLLPHVMTGCCYSTQFACALSSFELLARSPCYLHGLVQAVASLQ